jgi:predicted site-specific integrase-resolvase
MTKIQDTIPLPRGMKPRDAARYVGVSMNTFQKLIKQGLLPAPIKFPGLDRNIHDRQALDAAITAMAVAS